MTSLLTRAGLTQKRVEVNYQQPLELLDEIGEAWTSDYREGGFDVLLKNWQQTSEVNPELNLFLEDVHNISEIRRNLHEQAEEISKDMKFIREEGDRIGKIIHGMRRLGNMKSEVRPQNIHQMLDDCTDIMADLFSQQRVQIVKDFQASPDRVNVDRDEFIQSITNLMRNSLQSLIEARKIKGKRDGFFKISSTIREGNIVILLEDNGVGISSENQEKLFSTHFTTKSSDEGTGLGLSISRRFIRAYDGDLSFKESRSFESTVFEIKLPILQNEQQRKSVA